MKISPIKASSPKTPSTSKMPSLKVVILASAAVWAATGAGAYYVGKANADALVKEAIAKAGKAGAKGNQAALELALQNGGLSTYMGKDAKGVTLDSLLQTPGKIDSELLALWAAGINPKDLAKTMASLQNLPVGSQRDSLLAAVVGAWAKKDPAGYLASAASITNPKLREEGVNNALKSWAAENPQAALDWLKANPGSGTSAANQARYTAAISGFAASDPAAAFAFINALPSTNTQDANLRRTAMLAMMDGIATKGSFGDAVAMFNALPDGATKNQLNRALMDKWAVANPTDAAAWAATMPANQRNQYNNTIVAAYAQSDPAGAIKLATEMDAQRLAEAAANPNGGGRGGRGGQLTGIAFANWAQYDLDAPAKALNEMPAGPTKDSAIAQYARVAGLEDPIGGATWIKSISDPQTQQFAALQYYRILEQSNPAAIQELVNSGLISQQQLQQLANGGFGGNGGGGGNGAGGPGGGRNGGGNNFGGNNNGGGAVNGGGRQQNNGGNVNGGNNNNGGGNGGRGRQQGGYVPGVGGQLNTNVNQGQGGRRNNGG